MSSALTSRSQASTQSRKMTSEQMTEVCRCLGSLLGAMADPGRRSPGAGLISHTSDTDAPPGMLRRLEGALGRLNTPKPQPPLDSFHYNFGSQPWHGLISYLPSGLELWQRLKHASCLLHPLAWPELGSAP